MGQVTLNVRRFAFANWRYWPSLTKMYDLDFKAKSLLLLLLESGLSYIVVIESLYSYILNVNYTEICKLLLIYLYKQMGLSRYGAY